jgi:outer membrane immunogenic protein
LDWFYLGLNVGGASTDGDFAVVAQNLAFNQNRFSEPFHKLGFAGGGQIGYNWQTGMSVFGVEADAAWTNLKSSSEAIADPFFNGKGHARFSSSIDWLATVRGRAGIAATPALLLYVTGGLAVAGVNVTYQNAGSGSPTSPFLNTLSHRDTLFGWTAGFGAEYALGGNWSVKGEYLRVQFDSSTLNVPLNAASGFQGTVRASQDIDLFRFGVNYKL